MSFMSQPYPSRSQSDFSQPWSTHRANGNSKLRSYKAALMERTFGSTKAVDRSKKASKSPSPALGDCVYSMPPSCPCDSGYNRTHESFQNGTSSENLDDGSHWRFTIDSLESSSWIPSPPTRRSPFIFCISEFKTEDHEVSYHNGWWHTHGEVITGPFSIPEEFNGWWYPLGGVMNDPFSFLGEWTSFDISIIHNAISDEQNSHRDLEDRGKQRELLRKLQTHHGIFDRYKVQKEASRLSTRQKAVETLLDGTIGLENDFFHPPSSEIELEWCNNYGQLLLKTWRCAAGKSKSWKRCPRNTRPRHTHHHGVKRSIGEAKHQFAKSLLWLPTTFIRSQAKGKTPQLGYIVRHQEPRPVPERVRRYDAHDDEFEDAPIAQHRRHHIKPAIQDAENQELRSVMDEDTSREPASAFIRFTWKDGILVKGTGQLDRFLQIGLVLRTHWRITGFLRNESFADVYSLGKFSSFHLSATEVFFEAHVFFDEYYGNCAVYARRLQGRMKQSENFQDAFWYGIRYVVIIWIQKDSAQFRLRNTEEEFPILVDQDKCKKQAALQRRLFRNKPSFSAIAGEGWPRVNSRCPSKPMSESKSALEKELEHMEEARIKKNQKQKAKRQSQKEKRTLEMLQRTAEAVEA